MHSSHTVLSSFAEKWLSARPECAIALRFLPLAQRDAHVAFECLVFELEQTIFHVREAHVAQAKLHWWGNELANTVANQPRHPITQTLLETTPFSNITATQISALIEGALFQYDATTVTTFDQLIGHYKKLYTPLTNIEALLLPAINSSDSAQTLALAHALRESTKVTHGLETLILPLPLNLLARHQLTRAMLGKKNDQCTAALHEHLNSIQMELADSLTQASHLNLLRRVGANADQWRAKRAANAKNPSQILDHALTRPPLHTLWVAWRGARDLR